MRLLEHAESKFILGPFRSNIQLILFASILGETPIALYLGVKSMSLARSVLWSSFMHPVYTPVFDPLMVSKGIPAVPSSQLAYHLSLERMIHHFPVPGMLFRAGDIVADPALQLQSY
jgi:hypothetical protein